MALTQNEIYRFNDSVGGPISTGINGHELILTYFKTVHGFKARCSCGKRFGTVGGGNNNGAGFRWGCYALKLAFNEHIKAIIDSGV